MKLLVIGLNHKTAPVEIRECFSFPAERVAADLGRLTALESVREAAILSTCNRVELFLGCREVEAADREVRAWLSESRQTPLARFHKHLYVHEDRQGAVHGFRVASGLDSQILGEPQILGQMKQAYHLATEHHTTGLLLNKFFHRCFQVAKRVRSETAIGENAVSISYAAVELARKIFGELSKQSCLLIGAGEMCELAATHMVANGVGRVLVTNRTFERAEALAEKFRGQAFPLEALPERLHEADIVISSTGSSTHMVTRAMVEKALKSRRQRPMFLIDIAVPRDLDPAISEVDSAFLYDIDDLDQVVAQNKKNRQEAALAAEEIIAKEADDFLRWLVSLEVVPTIVALRRKFEKIRDQEVEQALARMPDLNPRERERVRELGRLLVNKLLHHPLHGLKNGDSLEESSLYVEALRNLFELHTTPGRD